MSGMRGNVIHSPVSNQGAYSYRSGIGLVPSSEQSVYWNDFYENPTTNAIPGTTAIIDTGATIVAAAEDAVGFTGALEVVSDGATEGAALYWPKGIQLGQGKKFIMEARVYTEAADDTDVQFGLTVANATTNPEDLWTTAATDLIAFGVLDGDATVTMLCDKDNSGSAAQLGTKDLSNSTWHTLAIEVNGSAAGSSMSAKGYVDGQLVLTWSGETTIPDDLTLAPFIGGRNGSAVGNGIFFDYVRWAITR